MLFLAAKPPEVLSSIVIAYGAGIGLALVIGSLIHAAFLMLACRLSRLYGVRYRRAFGTVLLCNLTQYGFAAIMALGLWLGLREDGSGSFRAYVFLASPINFVYLFAAGVVGHALVFSQRLGEREDPPIEFGQASTIAVIYLGLYAFLTSLIVAGVMISRVW